MVSNPINFMDLSSAVICLHVCFYNIMILHNYSHSVKGPEFKSVNTTYLKDIIVLYQHKSHETFHDGSLHMSFPPGCCACVDTVTTFTDVDRGRTCPQNLVLYYFHFIS